MLLSERTYSRCLCSRCTPRSHHGRTQGIPVQHRVVKGITGSFRGTQRPRTIERDGPSRAHNAHVSRKCDRDARPVKQRHVISRLDISITSQVVVTHLSTLQMSSCAMVRASNSSSQNPPLRNLLWCCNSTLHKADLPGKLKVRKVTSQVTNEPMQEVRSNKLLCTAKDKYPRGFLPWPPEPCCDWSFFPLGRSPWNCWSHWRRPPHRGSKSLQCLKEHKRLDWSVQEQLMLYLERFGQAQTFHDKPRIGHECWARVSQAQHRLVCWRCYKMPTAPRHWGPEVSQRARQSGLLRPWNSWAGPNFSQHTVIFGNYCSAKESFHAPEHCPNFS